MGPDIPFKPAEDLYSLLVPILVVIAIGLAATVAVALGARRFGGRFAMRGNPQRLRVLERLAVSRRAALLVVEWEGQRLLLGQSGEQLSLIAAAEKSPLPDADKAKHEAA